MDEKITIRRLIRAMIAETHGRSKLPARAFVADLAAEFGVTDEEIAEEAEDWFAAQG